MSQTREEALRQIIEACDQLQELAKRNDFEVIGALLKTIVERGNALLSDHAGKPSAPLN